ncbi:hypothetical protein J1G42_04425 [Cellulomonas sp. zg-ZUI222]|uniref:DUF4190 domain-containing protein n=1 Tax=Cellulomonas wangleii TaxID=2816956 RepID=A0ABX8D320_9CELL|nr:MULTISPECIES: hypothetical protein [Cellulomonas]MBO0899219.1 hypothetical protein [Cellulomonas sp. zg-ZUI22]MBO0920069.1 hypothetical protein [Cellulomonas wangleii]MBO0923502.1 hypothetical protein [Cellulomonas wangleii]QVI61843.1 hypothetical protein KG103_15570 [Cellulomonas wangleii]
MSQAPYPSYPASDQQDSLPPMPAKRSNLLSIISFPLSAIALLFVPILFGGVAIVLASIAKFSRREPLGTVAFVISIVATVIGIVLGAVVGMMSAVA